jgi:hypothetical protein
MLWDKENDNAALSFEWMDENAELFSRLARARRTHPYIDQFAQHLTRLLEFGTEMGAEEDDMFTVLEVMLAAKSFAGKHNL